MDPTESLPKLAHELNEFLWHDHRGTKPLVVVVATDDHALAEGTRLRVVAVVKRFAEMDVHRSVRRRFCESQLGVDFVCRVALILFVAEGDAVVTNRPAGDTVHHQCRQLPNDASDTGSTSAGCQLHQ